MTFGRYKGYTVADLIAEAPDYLAWLCNNTEFELGHILMDRVETAHEDAAREARLPSREETHRAFKTLANID